MKGVEEDFSKEKKIQHRDHSKVNMILLQTRKDFRLLGFSVLGGVSNMKVEIDKASQTDCFWKTKNKVK